MLLKALAAPNQVASIYQLWHQGSEPEGQDFAGEFLADVSWLGQDPLAFQEQIEARFDLQRREYPAAPYGFAIPELASTLAYMCWHTAQRLQAYAEDLFHAPCHLARKRACEQSGRIHDYKRLVSQLQAEAGLFAQLQQTLAAIDKQNPAYDQLLLGVELFTRILAICNPEPLPWLTKYYERFMDSEVGTAVHELARLQKGFGFYEPGPKRFPITRELIFAPQLQVLLLPTTGYLRDPIFVATRWSDVILSTVACRNYLVDGYVVTPYTFQKHDVSYHAALRYRQDQRYFQLRNWDRNQIRTFRYRQRKWGQALLTQVAALDDPALQQAVYWLLLEVLHNRGWVLAPSSFTGRWDQLHIRLRNDIKNLALLLMDQPTGCGDRLADIFRQSAQAQAWITAFWQTQGQD